MQFGRKGMFQASTPRYERWRPIKTDGKPVAMTASQVGRIVARDDVVLVTCVAKVTRENQPGDRITALKLVHDLYG